MSRPQPTQQQPGTYTYEQQHALMASANKASIPQLLVAAEFMSQVLQANGIPHALMGGFALKLQGNSRDTHDVDVAVGCTMQRLIEVVSAQPRIRRPAGPTSDVMRVFVLIGGELNPEVPELWVAVDLILPGKCHFLFSRVATRDKLTTFSTRSLGAPENPQTSLEVVTINTAVGQKQLPVIDLLHTMTSKLNAYYSRQNPKDYDDIVFLIAKHPEQIFAIRTQLNATHRQCFATSFAQDNAENAIRRVKHILGVVWGLL